MKFFRTHITRTFNVAVLLAGMVFYFLKPVNDHADHNAFTSWLQSNLKSSPNTDVLNQIRGLSANDGELESVIRQASVLVKAHAEDFKLPVDTQSKDENEVFQVLLKEWNAYQKSSAGMDKAVLIKQTKSYSVLPADALNFCGKSVAYTRVSAHTEFNAVPEYPVPPLINYHLSPISGGIAIGAP